MAIDNSWEISERAQHLHRQSTVVNGLAQPGKLPLAYQAMIDGGINLTNLTVAANENFSEAVLRIEEALSTLENHPHEEQLRIVLTKSDIEEVVESNLSGVLVGFQNAQPIEDCLDYLAVFYRLGLRVLQLTYQRRNLVGDGCSEPNDSGLSIYGKEMVAEANRLGILIDLSHVGYNSTLEAIETSTDPVVFSHANAHALHGVIRNKTDEQISALAEKGGVIGILAISRVLKAEGRLNGTDLNDYLDHIDYIVQLVGVDYVGVGLDISEGMTKEDFEIRNKTFLTQFPELKFGGEFPFEYYFTEGLSTAANFRIITEGLIKRGYDDIEISKIIGGNFLRVIKQVLKE